jgi:hypothetical protein
MKFLFSLAKWKLLDKYMYDSYSSCFKFNPISRVVLRYRCLFRVNPYHILGDIYGFFQSLIGLLPEKPSSRSFKKAIQNELKNRSENDKQQLLFTMDIYSNICLPKRIRGFKKKFLPPSII